MSKFKCVKCGNEFTTMIDTDQVECPCGEILN